MKDSTLLMLAGGAIAGYYFFVAKPAQQLGEAFAGGTGAVNAIGAGLAAIPEQISSLFTPVDLTKTVVPSTPAQAAQQAVKQAAIQAVGGVGVTQVQMAQAGIQRADQVRYTPIEQQTSNVYYANPLLTSEQYQAKKTAVAAPLVSYLPGYGAQTSNSIEKAMAILKPASILSPGVAKSIISPGLAKVFSTGTTYKYNVATNTVSKVI